MYGRFGNRPANPHVSRRLALSAAVSLCGLVAASPFARFNTDPPADDPAGKSGGGGSTPTVEELQRQLTDLQGKFGTLTTERDGLAGKVKTFEDSQKTAEQKLNDDLTAAQKRAEDLEKSEKGTRVQLAIERQARKLGISDEDAAVKLLDHSKIEFDKDGKPTNIDMLLTQLAKDKPYLVDGGGAGGSNGGGSGGGSNPQRQRGGTLTLEQVKNMTTAEINANWTAVQAAMAAAK